MPREGGWGALGLLLLEVAVWAGGPQGQHFEGGVANLATTSGRLWVASGGCVYDLEPSLEVPPGEGLCWPPSANATNKLLLPFDGGRRLLTCWTHPPGICNQWHHLRANETPTTFGEQLVSSLPQGSAAGQVYSSEAHWYLVVATSHILNSTNMNGKADNNDRAAISVKKDENPLVEETQRWNLAQDNYLYFVDAFLWGGRFFFPYHHDNHSMVPAVAILKPFSADHQVRPYGQTRLPCAGGTHILSSSFLQLPSGHAYLVVIVQVGKAHRTHDSSALCIFDLVRVEEDAKDCFLADFELRDKQKGGCVSILLFSEAVVWLEGGDKVQSFPGA